MQVEGFSGNEQPIYLELDIGEFALEDEDNGFRLLYEGEMDTSQINQRDVIWDETLSPRRFSTKQQKGCMYVHAPYAHSWRQRTQRERYVLYVGLNFW